MFGRHGKPPPASNDVHMYSILFPELRRGRDETYRRCELMTLTFDLGGHGACGWCRSSSSIRVPSLKFVCLAIRKIWRTKCVSINGPSDPDLWAFDLETGTQVASKVGNLPSKFGHARPLGSRIIRYVRDGRTDRRTDEQKQRLLPPPYGGGGITNRWWWWWRRWRWCWGWW